MLPNMHLSIVLEPSDNTLYADLAPGAAGEAEKVLAAALLQKALQEAGYGRIQPEREVIDQIQKLLDDQEPGRVAVKTLVDAGISVQLNSDHTCATLTLTPADGGEAMTLEQIKHVLDTMGIVKERVLWNSVEQALVKGEVKDLPIARSLPPVKGEDARFEPLVESEHSHAPEVDEQGVVDLMEVHSFTSVEAGRPLMRRIPATEGTPGMDVCGDPIKPVPGNDLPFANGLQGAAPSEQDENLLVATTKGHPVIFNNGVHVDPVLHLDTVGVHSGNVHFDGSLEVKGDICAGMKVDVTGDVLVKGVIEHAQVKAGNNILVKGGILGAELDQEEVGPVLIDAGGSLEAKFISLMKVRAGANIVVKEYISNSIVHAGHSLLLGQQGGKGMVFGGHCVAKVAVWANTLGNDSYLETVIEVGAVKRWVEECCRLEKALKARRREIHQLNQVLLQAKQNKITVLGKIDVDKSRRIVNTIRLIEEKAQQLEVALKACQQEIGRQQNAEVKVAKTIYPNVKLIINGQLKAFREESRGGCWRCKHNVLVRDEEC